MGTYIIKRMAYFLPTLLAVVFILFMIKANLPGDPVDDFLALISDNDPQAEYYLTDYAQVADKMGLTAAPFYVTLTPASYPDNIYKIIPISERNRQIEETLARGFSLPVLSWHGADNYFHIWLSNALSGDLGVSIIDNKLVSSKIGKAIKWTFLMMSISLVLSIVLSIPIGLWLSREGHQFWKKLYERISFFIFTIPLFWLCLLAVLYLTSSHYGLKFFPSVSIDPTIGRLGFWTSVGEYGAKLLLPAICWTLHTLAYITAQFKSSMLEELNEDYVITAYAKGLSKKTTAQKHVFKNALFPMITLFMGSIPSAIAGSVVIETIFNIPGIGRLMIQSIYSVDWNVVMGISMIVAVITMLSYLIADLLYAWANPKIRLS